MKEFQINQYYTLKYSLKHPGFFIAYSQHPLYEDQYKKVYVNYETAALIGRLSKTSFSEEYFKEQFPGRPGNILANLFKSLKSVGVILEQNA